MMLYSVHGARIVNLALDFITPLVARYRKVFFFACLFVQVLTGVLKHLLEFFNSTRKRLLIGHSV